MKKRVFRVLLALALVAGLLTGTALAAECAHTNKVWDEEMPDDVEHRLICADCDANIDWENHYDVTGDDGKCDVCGSDMGSGTTPAPGSVTLLDNAVVDPVEAKWGPNADNLTNSGTFVEALAAARSENAGNLYIQLQQNITGEKFFVNIASGTTLTLDFNSHTVSGCLEQSNYTLFDFCASDENNGDGKLILLDSSGSDDPGGISVSEGSPFVSTVPLVVEGGKYEGSGSSYAESSASAEINGGIFRSTESDAFNVRMVRALTIRGGTFRSDDSYALSCFLVDDTTINGGTFYHGAQGAMEICYAFGYVADDPSGDLPAFTLSEDAVIVDETPDDGSSDIILNYEIGVVLADIAADRSTATLTVASETGFALERITVNGTDDLTVWGKTQFTIPMPEGPLELSATFIEGTVIYFNNTTSNWTNVNCFAGISYDQGEDLGNGLYKFIVFGDKPVGFTNFQPGMPENQYPEGYYATELFTPVNNTTYSSSDFRTIHVATADDQLTVTATPAGADPAVKMLVMVAGFTDGSTGDQMVDCQVLEAATGSATTPLTVSGDYLEIFFVDPVTYAPLFCSVIR